jgi:uncharacterized BrkB/YihY/UPF0761 family membrane protein
MINCTVYSARDEKFDYLLSHLPILLEMFLNYPTMSMSLNDKNTLHKIIKILKIIKNYLKNKTKQNNLKTMVFRFFEIFFFF